MNAPDLFLPWQGRYEILKIPSHFPFYIHLYTPYTQRDNLYYIVLCIL